MSVDQEILLLEHEMELACQLLEMELARSIEIGADIGEAMGQSSESWHDNAPADAVLEEYALHKGKIAVLSNLTNKGSIVPYPSENDPNISIGSGATIVVPTWKEIINLLVIGDARFLYPAHVALHGEVELVSYNSPLAIALMGKRVGDACEANIHGKKVEITVDGVDQNTVHEVYESLKH